MEENNKKIEKVEETTKKVTEEVTKEVTKEVTEKNTLDMAKKMKNEKADINFISKVTSYLYIIKCNTIFF